MVVLAALAAIVVGAVFSYGAGAGLALLLAVAGIALSISRPGLTVLVLLAYFPFETWLLKFVPSGSFALLVPDVVCAGLLLAVALKVATTGDVRFVSKRLIAWLIGGLALVTLLSALANPVPVIDEVYWVRVSLRFAPIGLVAAIEPWSSWIRERLALVAFPLALAQSAVGLIELFGGMHLATFFWAGTTFALAGIKPQGDVLATVEDRIVAGTMGHYNIYAFLLLLLMGVMIADLLSGRVRNRIALLGGWTVVALSAAMIVLSQSRQNVLAMGVAILALGVIVWLRGSDEQRRTVGMALLAVVLLAMLAATSGRLAIADRFGRIAQAGYWEEQMHSDRGYAVTVIAPTALKSDPLLGAGPGAFHPSTGNPGYASGVDRFGLDHWQSKFVGDVGWAHFAAQVGLLGVLFVAMLGVLPLMGAKVERSTDSIVYAWTAAAFLTTMLGSNPLIYKPTSAVLWCIFGLASASIFASRQDERVSKVPDTA